MTTYLCLITVREGQVPHLRHIDCLTEGEISQFLAPVLAEWPQVHRVEVLDGDHLAFVMEAPTRMTA